MVTTRRGQGGEATVLAASRTVEVLERVEATRHH